MAYSVFIHQRFLYHFYARPAYMYFFIFFTKGSPVTFYYRVKRSGVRYCHDKLSVSLSVRPSVCNVGGLWSHALEFFENNFTAEKRAD